ncbi:hypothetical protein [Bacteroides neonati]|uniref:hypothetical protein n=1 Tax=Bacteroides neonati TaxID=1347393 RepID=UPI0004AEB666|nr:hypothetical protein [Bacteroides neonati]
MNEVTEYARAHGKQVKLNETINEQVRNKLSPFTNIIALIERYENTMNGEERRLIVEQILKSKSILRQSVSDLVKIK